MAAAGDPTCPWREDVCTRAAMNGHLSLLQWLRNQNPPCPWNEYACHFAAAGGHLSVLKWLRSQHPLVCGALGTSIGLLGNASGQWCNGLRSGSFAMILTSDLLQYAR